MINVSVLYNLYSLHFLSFDFSKNRNDLTCEFLYLSFLLIASSSSEKILVRRDFLRGRTFARMIHTIETKSIDRFFSLGSIMTLFIVF